MLVAAIVVTMGIVVANAAPQLQLPQLQQQEPQLPQQSQFSQPQQQLPQFSQPPQSQPQFQTQEPQSQPQLPQSEEQPQSQLPELELPQFPQSEDQSQLPESEDRFLDYQYIAQPYSFKFNIADGVGGVRFAHIAQGDSQKRVQGSYSYVRPDGILMTVRYIADENGFRPEITEEPAPTFEHDPNHGTAMYTVALPYTDEYGVKVTAQQLQHYNHKNTHLKALDSEVQ